MELDAVDAIALRAAAGISMASSMRSPDRRVGAVPGQQLGDGARAAEQIHHHRIRGVYLGIGSVNA